MVIMIRTELRHMEGATTRTMTRIITCHRWNVMAEATEWVSIISILSVFSHHHLYSVYEMSSLFFSCVVVFFIATKIEKKKCQ